MFSGKCWQVQYSRRNRGPQVGGSPPGPSPSRGRTSSRGGHAGNRHSLRRENQADRVSRWTLGPKPIGLCPGTGLGLLSNLRLGSSRKTLPELGFPWGVFSIGLKTVLSSLSGLGSPPSLPSGDLPGPAVLHKVSLRESGNPQNLGSALELVTTGLSLGWTLKSISTGTKKVGGSGRATRGATVPRSPPAL